MPAALWEPDFDRLLTVIRRDGEPDRVPFLELSHDGQTVAAVMGGPFPDDPDEERTYRIEFMSRLGYDYVRGQYAYGFGGVGRLLADDTATGGRGQRGWQDEHHGPIESWEDFEKYKWPRIEDASFEDIEKLEPLLPDGMKAVAALPGGVFENLSRLMGYEPLCFALVEDPDLVQAVADKIGECELALFEVLGAFEHVGALWINDDMGFKTQTIIAPDDLRRFVFPWQKRLAECAHAHGKPVLLHACGNLSEVMDDLIDDVGIDAKHSFEDVIQPVAEFKRRYGSRVAALGGIEMDVLAGASEDEVRAYTRHVIEDCAPGGGWALGSGNTVANYVPVQNFLAMLDEGRKVGMYS
ncbi:MAG: uroporphyrinogen decarboxylase family protein [Armatimonadota bacterium]|jgi:uroporphyrinogen decarboxylase